MLGYSEKSYGWRGLALDKHWDSQCPAMEHSVRKQRSHFLLVLELWGPDSSWKQQFNWWAVLCSSRNLWKNFGWLIHNSPGVPRNMWLGWDPWHSCKGESASSTQCGQQPSFSYPGNPSVSMRGAGLPPAAQGWNAALGCFMRMLLWGRVSEGAGPAPWDNTCNDLRNPSQPVHASDLHGSVCVCLCVM